MKDLDRVALTRALPEFKLSAGDIGTVVHVYEGGKAYEVEFVSLQGRTLAVETLLDADLRMLGASEIAHARAFA